MKLNPTNIALWFLDIGINVAIIFGLVFAIQSWIIAPFDVSGASMCNTFNYIDNKCETNFGEKIIINEATYLFNEPKRGEVVVFKTPNTDEKYLIKRIIGLPGETVEIRDGKIYIREENSLEYNELKESYLNEDNFENTEPYFSNLTTFKVPENSYFMLGDNRKSSTDSRSCFSSTIDIDCVQTPEKSFVSKEYIRGRAWIVWWPLSNLRIVKY